MKSSINILSGNLTTIANDFAQTKEVIRDLNDYTSQEKSRDKDLEPTESTFRV